MRLWPARRTSPVPAAPAESDLIAYARAHVTSRGARALLDEAERGRQRRSQRTGEPRRAREAVPTPDGALHAHEVTPNDAALIRAMAGARFGPDAVVTLPSGKTITGAEMQRWIETEGQS